MEQTRTAELNVMVIGISLGAQLAGFIGQDYEVQRIIALDPAGPLYENAEVNERLDPSDAKFVDVWHCNMGQLGTKFDVGHVSYIINGGKEQKACIAHPLKTASEGNIFFALGTSTEPSCSHIQCTQYFKESINTGSCQYVGVRCKNYNDFKTGKCRSCGAYGENCIIMGYDTDKFIKELSQEYQRFYVKTNDESPFCDDTYINLDGYLATYNSTPQKKFCRKKKKRAAAKIISFINFIEG